MSFAKCVNCGVTVNGDIQDVKLSYFCKECCVAVKGKNSRVYEGCLKVSATRAREEYGCDRRDLQILHCSYRQNPVEIDGRPMRLYLRAEVQYLGRLRLQQQEEDAKLKEKGALIGKKIELEEIIGIRLSSLDAILRKFLLEDYLDHSVKVETTFEEVHKRFSVLKEVQEILAVCPLAHPRAVFDFCLEHPHPTPSEFEHLRDNMRKVFHLEGARILFRIPDTKRMKLVGTPLESVLHEFLERDSRTIILNNLQRWVSESTAEDILSDIASSARIARGGEESDVARKLYQFWLEREDREVREQRLKTALKKHSLPYPKDDAKQQAYINGELDCDVEELVGEAEVEHRLRSLDGEICVLCMSTNKDLFGRYRYECLMSYEEAVAHAVEAAVDGGVLLSDDHRAFFTTDTDSLLSYDFDEIGIHYFDDDIFFDI